MKPSASAALTWDGARFPVHRLPAKARVFLGKSTPPAKFAALLAEEKLRELRICWVPRLRGGNDTLCLPFPTKNGRRLSFQLLRTISFDDVLGAVYRRI